MGSEKRSSFARLIAHELYRSGQSTKTALMASLGASLPTVRGTVRTLMEQGVVVQDGLLASSGGRKPEALALNGAHAFAIGVDITANHLSLVAVDLRGTLRWRERLSLPFSTDNTYCTALSEALDAFLQKHDIPSQKVLGAGLSLPGILSSDGHTLADSHALRLSDFSLQGIEQALRFPVLAVNDANAAAMAEKRLLPPEGNLVYLSLSNSVGGAIFMGGTLYEGGHGRSGEFGHMPLIPNGRACYCGKHGCYDAYGSALLLSAPYQGQLTAFFTALARKEPQAVALWRDYLFHLAVMCNHLRMAFDCTVMLGGYVGAQLEPWLEEIRAEAAKLNTFEDNADYLCLCRYQTEAAATGAALMHIEKYIDTL